MNRFLLIVLTGFMVAGTATSCLALGPLNVEAELPLYSNYVWRGMNNTDDWVLQPSLSVGVLGFTAGIWGNMDLTDVNKEDGKFRERDFTLEYGFNLPLVELGAGIVFYEYPNASRDNTSEVYLFGTAGVLLSPTLYIYKDVDKYKGVYWEASISYGFKVGEAVDLDLTGGLGLGSAGYISSYFSGQTSTPDTDFDASMTDAYLRVELPYGPLPLLTITPSVTFTSLIGDGRDALDNDPTLYAGKKDHVVFGLAAGFSF